MASHQEVKYILKSAAWRRVVAASHHASQSRQAQNSQSGPSLSIRIPLTTSKDISIYPPQEPGPTKPRPTTQDDIECEICFNIYDEADRRPNSLPCGHTFCRLCMAREIVNGKRTCPTCRKPHKARSVLNLPINVALERVIRNRGKSNKRKLDSEDDDGEDGGRCTMHKKSVLYFYCETHLTLVCRDCTVIEHPVSSCKVIPIKEHINRRKKGNICKTGTNVTNLNDTLLRLSNFVDEKNETICSKKNRIEELKKEIKTLDDSVTFEKVSRDAAKVDVNKGEAFKEQNNVEKQLLENANSMSVINKCVRDIDRLSSNIRKWRQNVDKHLDDCYPPAWRLDS